MVAAARAQVRSYRGGRVLTSAGGAATEVLAPLIAVTMLNAGPGDVAALLAITLGVSLLLRLPLAVWADKQPTHVRWMILFAIISGVWSAAIPLLWLTGLLNLPVLLVWVGVNVALLTVLSVLGHGVLNRITEPDERVAEIGNLNAATSTGEIVGQSGAPALIAVMPAPIAMLFDTVASFAAAIWWRRIAGVETLTEPDDEVPAAKPTGVILQDLARRPVLWFAALAAILSSVTAPLGIYYFVTILGVDAAVMGVLLAAGALGGICAGALLGKLYSAWSSVTVVSVGFVLMGAATAAVAVLPASNLMTYLAIAAIEFATAAGGTLVMATLFGELQADSKPTDVARTMSVASFVVEALGLIGIAASAGIIALATIPGAYLYTGLGLIALAVIYLATRHLRSHRARVS